MVVLCEECARPGHRYKVLHDDECASLSQLRTDPAVRPSGRDGDTSSLRLLLRLCYVASRLRSGTLPPLQYGRAEEGEEDEEDVVDVIEDDLEALKSLEDNSLRFPVELHEALEAEVQRAKYLLAPIARGPSGEAAGFLSRMFCNAFGLSALRDPLGRTRQAKREVGCGLFASAALINHSCVPNSEVQLTKRGFLQIVTLRHIEVGEPLTISYLPLPISPGRDAVEDRREALKDAFFFDCDCELHSLVASA